MRFPIVIYPSEDREGGRFTAHCLNMDIVADDDNIDGAVSNLLDTIDAALRAAQKHNANAFRDAPQKYWDMLEHAQELPRELWERIVFNATKRVGTTEKSLIDVEKEVDLRQSGVCMT